MKNLGWLLLFGVIAVVVVTFMTFYNALALLIFTPLFKRFFKPNNQNDPMPPGSP